jgi:hypothetical protein
VVLGGEGDPRSLTEYMYSTYCKHSMIGSAEILEACPLIRPVFILYCTVLYCTVLYCTVLCCTALYCTVLHIVALYCGKGCQLHSSERPLSATDIQLEAPLGHFITSMPQCSTSLPHMEHRGAAFGPHLCEPWG